MIAIATIKIKMTEIGSFDVRTIGRIRMAIRLVCIPGVRPVKVPVIIPRKKATKIKNNIILFSLNFPKIFYQR